MGCNIDSNIVQEYGQVLLSIDSNIVQEYGQVLLSIDSNIERIHEMATKNGGRYTPEQRNMLQ